MKLLIIPPAVDTIWAANSKAQRTDGCGRDLVLPLAGEQSLSPCAALFAQVGSNLSLGLGDPDVAGRLTQLLAPTHEDQESRDPTGPPAIPLQPQVAAAGMGGGVHRSLSLKIKIYK